MISLNEILKEYMKNNMDLDRTIQELAEGIKKAKNERQGKEQEINGMIREITQTKVAVGDAGDIVKKSHTESKILELKNKLVVTIGQL